MDKILTVVIPTYNMEKYLAKCLTSLIIDDAGLMNRLEVLVVIDGAKDASSEIALSFQNKFPNTFRVIDKENGNYGSCINRGLQEATGKYIKVLDADDSFSKENFSNYLDLLKGQDADLVLNDCVKVNPEGTEVGAWSFQLDKQCVLPFIHIFPQMHCVAYKTDLLKKMNYVQTEGISYTDQEWVFYPMTVIKSIYYIPLVLYRYLVGRNGQTIDPAIYLTKGFGHECIITKRMLEYIGNENSQIDDYLMQKLLRRFNEQYTEIIVHQGNPKLSELVQLDQYVEANYRQIYIYANDYCKLSKFVNFHFVDYWRKHGYSLSKYHPAVLVYKLELISKMAVKKVISFFKS